MEYNKDIKSDPRLMEYLTKKKYYDENKMTPCISLELEYSITPSDIERLKQIETKLLKSNNIFFPKTSYKNVRPKIQYKTQLHYDGLDQESAKLPHDPSTKEMIDYTTKETDVPAFLSRTIEKHKSGRIYDGINPNQCINTIREQFYNDKPFDPEMMNDMMLGMPNHTRKSYGFDDPFEHYFDYIDGDIQRPDHVVLDFPRGGESARLENTKQKTRTMM